MGTTVEDRCSGWAVDEKIRGAVRAQPGGILAGLASGARAVDARLLAPALARGCPLAGQILAETAEDLAFALSHAVHLFHPAAIVLGGGLALVGEPWRGAVAAALPRFVMRAFTPVPRVSLAALGGDAVPAGALLLAAGHRRRAG